jgi:3-hydroxyisobutyrate dehydrogenase-like beta-hydroxyacid dehydrogenase
VNPSKRTIGFIGLGVMGEPICRNLRDKSGADVIALDRDALPLHRLATRGVRAATTVREVGEMTDIVFLSLPSGEVVAEVVKELLPVAKEGQVIVDLGTSPVDLTRELAQKFSLRGATFIDAPVARTRAAAEAGTLAVMVGADVGTFETVRPLIATFASEITHCGPVGCGQVVKILNNMVLFETVMALSEAKAIAEWAGVDPERLFDALSKGSADSFALRNHGMKAMLKDNFPLRAFSASYARKDLSYALRLAHGAGVPAEGARTVDGWLAKAIEQGMQDYYWPVISRLIGRRGD